MTITRLTCNLTPNALRRLTAQASRPESTTLAVEQWARTPAYECLDPLEKGSAFHKALARFLTREELRPYQMFYPFMTTIRAHLRAQGYDRFDAEVEVGNQAVHGRADIIAMADDHSAVIEVKVVGKLPQQPPAQHVIQVALPGFLRKKYQSHQVILVYVDLIGKRIRIFAWANHRRACFRPWELPHAA
jgi:hypothetical protein